MRAGSSQTEPGVEQLHRSVEHEDERVTPLLPISDKQYPLSRLTQIYRQGVLLLEAAIVGLVVDLQRCNADATRFDWRSRTSTMPSSSWQEKESCSQGSALLKTHLTPTAGASYNHLLTKRCSAACTQAGSLGANLLIHLKGKTGELFFGHAC